MATEHDGISYDLQNVKVVPRLIREIERRGSKVEKPLKRWGTYMLAQEAFLFRRGWRGPVKWKPLAPVTIIMRRYRKGGAGRTGPARILQDTGALKRSIKTVTFSHKQTRAQAIFTRSPHARTHQKGGTMNVPAKTIRPKKKKALMFNVGGETVFATKVYQPAKTVKVPQRKVVFITAADTRKALNLLKVHAAEVSKTKVR